MNLLSSEITTTLVVVNVTVAGKVDDTNNNIKYLYLVDVRQCLSL